VETLNKAIAAAVPGSTLSNCEPVEDPMDGCIECCIKALDFYLCTRLQGHTLLTLESLDTLCKSAEDLMETIKRCLPDRIGATDSHGDLMEWRIKKFHDLLHVVCVSV
jgi:hypothetical protein